MRVSLLDSKNTQDVVVRFEKYRMSLLDSKSMQVPLLQGGAKVTLPKKKLNISIIARANELIFYY